jgi:hypothetical protein
VLVQYWHLSLWVVFVIVGCVCYCGLCLLLSAKFFVCLFKFNICSLGYDWRGLGWSLIRCLLELRQMFVGASLDVCWRFIRCLLELHQMFAPMSDRNVRLGIP